MSIDEGMNLQPLRVLVVASPPRARTIVAAVSTLGHSVHSVDTDLGTAARAAADAACEVVVVAPEDDLAGALRLIALLTHDASFPVVAALSAMDPELLEKAVAAGASGAVVGADVEGLRIALLVARRRFLDYRSLRDAFDRRAEIEQAKGLLMARHGINGEQAFAMLREHSQRTNRKLVEIAGALSKAHVLLKTARNNGDDAPEISARDGAEAAPYGTHRSVI
jgi:response regulator NasT